MRSSKIVKLRKLQEEWHSIKSKSRQKTDPELVFAVGWVDELRSTLIKHRNDHEFVLDVVSTAAAFFNESMTDQEKTDAFTYLLGRVVLK